MALRPADTLAPDELVQLDAMRRSMARSMILQWKISRALYAQYGGRIIYQQLGPEPLDAYRKFLEEKSRAGDFAIYDKSMETEFWHYFTDESIHDFMDPAGSDAASAFRDPPW